MTFDGHPTFILTLGCFKSQLIVDDMRVALDVYFLIFMAA